MGGTDGTTTGGGGSIILTREQAIMKLKMKARQAEDFRRKAMAVARKKRKFEYYQLRCKALEEEVKMWKNEVRKEKMNVVRLIAKSQDGASKKCVCQG